MTKPKYINNIIHDASEECAYIMRHAMTAINANNYIKTKGIFKYKGEEFRLKIQIKKIEK